MVRITPAEAIMWVFAGFFWTEYLWVGQQQKPIFWHFTDQIINLLQGNGLYMNR